MVASRAFELHENAAILCQLADFVEQSGLSAGEVGAMLADAFGESPNPLGREAQQDLHALSGSATGAEEFARGLRKQADILLQQARSTATVGLPLGR